MISPLPSLPLSLLLSPSVVCFLHFTVHSLDQNNGPVGTDGLIRNLWSASKLSCVRNGTDDACFAPAIQWEKRRTKEEMGTVRGLSPTRSWGKCSQHTVWFVPVVVALVKFCAAFNLDAEERVVFNGPRGSYFGYSVEFFTNSSRWSPHPSSLTL